MRHVVFVGLAGALLAVGTEARAQDRYFGRTTTSRAAAVRESDEPPSLRSVDRGRSEGGEYRRARSRVPVPEARPAPQARRNYFPGLPTGQGPNRNYIDPSRLCVPGRRAFIYGR